MSYDNFDDMAERSIWPWCNDESHDRDDVNYDDTNDFYNHFYDDDCDIYDNGYTEEWDESMDGDHDSAMESAGWGTDEDYGYYGEDY